MAIQRPEFLEVLKDSYSAYYNIVPCDAPEGLPLAFRADYFSRAERYWISKSIPIWGNETNEYAYIFSAPSFDSALAERCIDFALKDGLPRVRPHREHQYTNIKVLFVADGFDEPGRRTIQKKSFSRSYKFSLHGFTNLLTAAVDLSESRAYTNKAGHELAGYFKKLFASREEKA